MNMDRMPKQHEAKTGDDALKPTHFREPRMTRTILMVALLTSAAPAFAEPVKIKPVIDARLRYESVDQVPIARNASAITARVRAGVEAKTKAFAVLIEGEGTLAISEKYNSGVNGKSLYPIVADPENIELNRAQVQLLAISKTVVTLGRQRINLDDQRFVGSVGFRDNEQTFDAARIEYSGIKNVKADVTYSWSQRTIWGVDGFGARQQAVSGDNIFANLSYKHKYGTLTGFAYLIDQDEAAISGFRMSSKTFGARFAGSAPLSKVAKLTYAASYARQSDYNRNPNNHSADYLFGELGVEAKGFKLLGGYEVLGADKGVALTSFQTPYATLHKFNGWADKFLVTPPNGLQDVYATLGYTKPKVGKLSAVSAQVNYHSYRSDRLGIGYGNEIGAQLSAKLKKYTFTLKYADYNAKAFATDTRKFWAAVEWAF
jgi:Alginate export